MQLPALARRHSTDNLSTIRNSLLCMKCAVFASNALHQYPRVFVDQNAHLNLLLIQ